MVDSDPNEKRLSPQKKQLEMTKDKEAILKQQQKIHELLDKTIEHENEIHELLGNSIKQKDEIKDLLGNTFKQQDEVHELLGNSLRQKDKIHELLDKTLKQQDVIIKQNETIKNNCKEINFLKSLLQKENIQLFSNSVLDFEQNNINNCIIQLTPQSTMYENETKMQHNHLSNSSLEKKKKKKKKKKKYKFHPLHFFSFHIGLDTKSTESTTTTL